MRRLLRPSAFLAALLIGTTVAAVGCTYVNAPALAISEGSTKDPYFTMSAKDLRTQVDEKLKTNTRTQDPTTISTANIAEYLSAQVVLKVQEHELDRRGITITEEDKTKAEQSLSQSSQGQSATPSPEDIEFAAGSSLLRDRLLENAYGQFGALAKREEAARVIYDDAVKAGYTIPGELCLHAIEIAAIENATASSPPPTDEQLAAALTKATEAKRRIDAGEPFEIVADEVSAIKEQVPGGDLSCRPDDGSQNSFPTELITLLADVPVGSITPPSLFGGSYILVRVDNRRESRTPTFDEVREQAEAAADEQLGSELLDGLREDLFTDSVITIDPKFGTWDPEQFRVVPPEGASSPTTPTTTTPPFDPSSLDIQGQPGAVATDPQETVPPTTTAPDSSSTSTAGATSSTSSPGGSTTTSNPTSSSTTAVAGSGSTTTTAVGASTTVTTVVGP